METRLDTKLSRQEKLKRLGWRQEQQKAVHVRCYSEKERTQFQNERSDFVVCSPTDH
jgi:hypothetical protein